MPLNFAMKVNDKETGFFTPHIKVASVIKKNEKELPASLALKVGYIVKAVVDNNPDAYTDKTKYGAGKDLLAIVSGLPTDSVYTLYLPTKADDRDSDDMGKFTACVSVNQADMLSTCKALASIGAIMSKAEDESATIAKAVKKTEYTVTQPVYFKDESGKGKTRGGAKVTTFTL